MMGPVAAELLHTARELFDALAELDLASQLQQLNDLEPTQPDLVRYVRRLLEADRVALAHPADLPMRTLG
jgi:hypothetical protein